MTEYEKLSLALLSTIAQGISLQMTHLDTLQPAKGMVVGHDHESLGRFAAVRASWQSGAARLAKLIAAAQPKVS